MLRFLTAGESHGMALTAIIEGLPAGLVIKDSDINTMLARRQNCYGRGNRMKKIEKDRVIITGGLRHGATIGSPLSLYLENKDWLNRKDKNPSARKIPRPGHADLAGALKYGFEDIQNVIERSSARETAIRTAVGAVTEILLAEFGIIVTGHVIKIGRKAASVSNLNMDRFRNQVCSSPVYCADPKGSKAMCAEIDKAKSQGDTLGGIFEVIACNVPIGLGSFVHWDRRLDGKLAQVIMSIPSVKAVEIGEGFKACSLPGSRVHDRLYEKNDAIIRRTNRAGGIEGGVSNGDTIIVRGYAKPISSLRNPLSSVNLETMQETKAPYVRSDVWIVPAASVIGEALVSWVIAERLVEKFGGDSVKEMRNNYEAFMNNTNLRVGRSNDLSQRRA